MYNPDKGIFSRIKEVEQKDSKNVLILEQSISEIGNSQEEEKNYLEKYEDYILQIIRILLLDLGINGFSRI
jgi:hypothetical protein